MSDNYPVDKAIERLEARIGLMAKFIDVQEQAHAELAANFEQLRGIVEKYTGATMEVTDGLEERIAAIESPAPAPDPVCAKCGHDKCHHIGFGAFCAASHCECGGWYVEPVPTAEPEPAPLDPVCFECGWPKSIHEDGDEFIPSPELDPVRLEAAARALLLSFNPSNRWDSDEQRDWHDTYLDQAASVIRAYGRDGAR